MAAVQLRSLWLNLAADPAVAMSFPYMSTLTWTKEQPGEVRRYANGRTRIIRRKGKPRSAEATLSGCSREQIAWLEEHVGALVCVRDDRGRKMYATYLTAPVTEAQHRRDRGDVTLAFAEVSHSEAV
jgi:hypothetical protein